MSEVTVVPSPSLPEVAVAPSPSSMEPQVQSLLELAIEKNLSVDALERLVQLQERVMDRQSAQAFSLALAAFQEACPSIPKVATAKVATKSGGEYSYRFADLHSIVSVARPHLRANGLSFTWDSAVQNAGASMKTTCYLRHVDGHASSASFECPTDAGSPGMSPQQRFASALTYSRRQSLVMVLGLTTCDPDVDGAEVGERLSPGQVAQLETMVEESGANRLKFLVYMGVGEMEDILQRDWRKAVVALEAKKGGAA